MISLRNKLLGRAILDQRFNFDSVDIQFVFSDSSWSAKFHAVHLFITPFNFPTFWGLESFSRSRKWLIISNAPNCFDCSPNSWLASFMLSCYLHFTLCPYWFSNYTIICLELLACVFLPCMSFFIWHLDCSM